MEGQGEVVFKKAPDFTLEDSRGGSVQLSQAVQSAPALLVFYPGDFTPVCTKQLCNYKDNYDSLEKFGLQVFGISKNSIAEHKDFAKAYDIPFSLLSDPGNKVAKAFGCTSLLMFGGVSRAVFVVDKKGMILYRYVEPTALTRRSADELVEVLEDLKARQLI